MMSMLRKPRDWLTVLAFMMPLFSGAQTQTPAPSSGVRPPPNLVQISAQLVTAGQPSADWLATLRDQGFDAVIYLAPFSVPDALRDEPKLVADQGLLFHHLPIPFDAPSDTDFERFSALLKALQGKKVLVHCQVNLRASTLSFLYRVIHEKTPPGQAYESVSQVWVPQGPWRRLMLTQLRSHGIGFDPF
jgi:protein tyrosine phosphatase (PTP) superfamily phosphohydrolase (DUF442 family)